MHRRIDIAEIPLIRRNLAARVDVEAAQHQPQLLLCEVEVHHGERHRVEGEVPGGIPRVLPLVRHRDHVGVQHVEPIGVAHVAAGAFQQRMTPVLAQPALQVEVVELLAPEHSRQRLAVHAALILRQRPGRDPLVELIGVGDPALEDLLETAEGILHPGGRQPQSHRLAAARRHVEDVVGRRLGPRLGGIHRVALSRDDVAVKRILDVRRSIGLVPQTLRVAFVLGEEQLGRPVAMKPVLAQITVHRLDDVRPRPAQRRLDLVRVP